MSAVANDSYVEAKKRWAKQAHKAAKAAYSAEMPDGVGEARFKATLLALKHKQIAER